MYDELFRPGACCTMKDFVSGGGEVEEYWRMISGTEGKQMICISTPAGNGLSHLLQAGCHRRKELFPNERSFYVRGEFLAYSLNESNSSGHERLFGHLMQAGTILFDNPSRLLRCRMKTRFLKRLALAASRYDKFLVMGNREDEEGQLLRQLFPLADPGRLIRIPLPESGVVYRILKQLCRHENSIPDRLLYEISGYRAPISAHINCLIAIRFKSREAGFDLHAMDSSVLRKVLELDDFFHSSSQFRPFLSPVRQLC